MIKIIRQAMDPNKQIAIETFRVSEWWLWKAHDIVDGYPTNKGRFGLYFPGFPTEKEAMEHAMAHLNVEGE